MLKFLYESGNDTVAFSRKNVIPKIKEFAELYKKDNKVYNNFKISQVDEINAIGNMIYEGEISHKEVVIVIEELEKELHFDEEGTLNWYEVVPSFEF